MIMLLGDAQTRKKALHGRDMLPGLLPDLFLYEPVTADTCTSLTLPLHSYVNLLIARCSQTDRCRWPRLCIDDSDMRRRCRCPNSIFQRLTDMSCMISSAKPH